MNNTKQRRQTTAEIALDNTRKKKIIRSMSNGLASFLGITTGIISPIVDSATSLWQKISISDANYVDIEKCLKLAKQASISMPGNEWNMKEGITLEKTPSEIKDKFSAVLGSGFHAAQRIITPMKHE